MPALAGGGAADGSLQYIPASAAEPLFELLDARFQVCYVLFQSLSSLSLMRLP